MDCIHGLVEKNKLIGVLPPLKTAVAFNMARKGEYATVFRVFDGCVSWCCVSGDCLYEVRRNANG